MPKQWDGTVVEKQFRGSVYTIKYKYTGKYRLIIDGTQIDGTLAPARDAGNLISIVCEY
jgi:cellobiose phosphorylase